jgi:hypothetical protein
MSSSELDKHDTPESDEYLSEKRAAESVDENRDIEKQDLDAVHDAEITPTKSAELHHVEVDPNIVDFEGPDDPENPLNWSTKRKWINGTFLSILTFIT